MSPSDSLSLPIVIERFGQAQSALDELRERLRNLALAEEEAADRTQSLQAASLELNALVQQITLMTSALAETLASIQAAVELAHTFLDAMPTKQLLDRLDEIEEVTTGRLTSVSTSIDERLAALDAVEARIAELATTTDSRMQELVGRIDDGEAARAEASDAREAAQTAEEIAKQARARADKAEIEARDLRELLSRLSERLGPKGRSKYGLPPQF